MRIAMVAPRSGAGGGGVARHVERLAAGVAAAGHEVELLSVERAAQPRGLAERFDTLHVHGFGALPALRAPHAGGLGVVWTAHLHRAAPSRLGRVVAPVSRRLGAPAAARADVVICGCAAEADRLAQLAPAVASRVRVVPEGVDVAAIRAAEPAEPARLGPLVLAVGHPAAAPGVERLVAALPGLPEGFVLAIPGEGPALGALRAHAADLAVEHRVRFLGRLDAPVRHRWLRSADVVASMADAPLAATALLEARAAGAPVVACDVAAHREADALLGAGGIHLVSPQASPLAIADVLAAVVASPTRSASDAVPAWDAVAELHLAIYGRCAGGSLPAEALAAAPTEAA